MAFDPRPTLFFGTSYSENGTVMTIPISAFPELTPAEADAASGDSRKMIYAIINKLATAVQETNFADRSTKMRITKNFATQDAASGTFVADYTFRFFLTSSGLEITEE